MDFKSPNKKARKNPPKRVIVKRLVPVEVFHPDLPLEALLVPPVVQLALMVVLVLVPLEVFDLPVVSLDLPLEEVSAFLVVLGHSDSLINL